MSIKIKVFGPRRKDPPKEEVLWSAQVELVSTPKFAEESASGQSSDGGFAAARALFLGDWPDSNLSIFSQDHVLAPGTYFALCRVLSVTLKSGRKSLTWSGNAQLNSFIPLLLQAKPSDWVNISTPATFPADTFPDSTLLAGEIPVAALDAAPAPNVTLLLPGFEKVESIVFNASGFAFRGARHLPWQLTSEAILSPMQAYFPFPDAASNELRVELDRGRFDQATTARWTAAFAFLRQLLAGTRGTIPEWARLELSAAPIPQFSWQVLSGVAGNPNLQLALGETRLLLSLDADAGEAVLSAPAVSTFAGDRAASSQTIVLQIASPKTAPKGAKGLWHYTAKFDAAGKAWAEKVAVSDVDALYDAITLATDLRLQFGLPVPDPTAARVDPALLWTGLRLENGWAQFPFFNVTESAYLRAGILPPPSPKDPSSQLFRGAAIFGNEETDRLPSTDGEQPWSIALLDAASFEGKWTFQRIAIATGSVRDWRIDAIDLTLTQPELALDGFFWLGTEVPTSRDALPSLDNWVAAVASLPVRTPDENTRYPSPHLLHFASVEFSRPTPEPDPAKDPGPAAALGPWQVSLSAHLVSYAPLVREVLALGKDGAALLEQPPLVWQQHPRMPCIQAVPLTQNQKPPNYPSPSRELAPFELPILPGSAAQPVPVPDVKKWIFGNKLPNGARAWPQALGDLKPAKSWSALPGTGELMPELGLASLSIPGLLLDHTLPGSFITEDPGGFLPLQFRFDLPYTDELNALAELPRDPNEPPLAPLPPIPPLQRADFPAFWHELRQIALLASVDAAPALSSAGVSGLVEPFFWPATSSLDTTAYPGTLQFKDAAQTMTLDRNGGSLLCGFQGNFDLTAGKLRLLSDGTAGTFAIVAGTMSATVATGQARDQRGLNRAATTNGAAGSRLLKTKVQREAATGAEPATLCSLTVPVALTAGDRQWQFWAHDLPVIAEPTATHFSRALTRSGRAEDVNDPVADSPKFIHLAGYEWRLGDTASGATPFLQLFGLQVFPLTLEEVIFDADDHITTIVLAARLQLPRTNAVELTNTDNVVLLTFTGVAGALSLTNLALPPPTASGGSRECVWLLDDQEGPLLRVQSFALTGTALTFGGLLEFYWMDAVWQLPIDPAPLPSSDGNTALVKVPIKVPAAPAGGPLALTSVELEVAFKTSAATRLAPVLHFQWGDTGGLLFTADRTVTLLGTPPTVPLKEQLVANGTIFPVKPTNQPTANEATAIQISWELDKAAPGTLQALPGMHLSDTTPATGYAVMAFSLGAPAGAGTIPTFNVLAAAFEGLFPCRWNRAIRDIVGAVPESDLFHSSAGDLMANYTLEAEIDPLPGRAVSWVPRLLLNGWLESVNLISWPANAESDPGSTLATIDGFANSSATLPAGAAGTLATLAGKIKANPNWVIHLEGHADPRQPTGSLSNHVLSRKRAMAVRDVLVSHDVPASQLIVVAYGDTRLTVSANGDPANSPNRRVEVRRHPSVVLPSLTGGTLDHLRHTVRILFNQHPVTGDDGPIVAAGKGQALFGLKDSWQFLAVVEHQVAEVTLAAGTGNLKQDRRWSAVQEVRLATPTAFRKFLQALKDFRGLDLESGKPVSLPKTLAGYENPTLLGLLLGSGGAAGAIENLGDALVVEASVPLWVRPGSTVNGQFTSLQFLPSGTQRGMLSSLADLDATPEESPWYLLTLPFLSRLQAVSADASGSVLAVDPIKALQTAAGTISPLLLALTSRQSATSLVISLSDFDTLVFRKVSRLDPASLIEGWFRLQNPPGEKSDLSGLVPIMDSLPPNSPGRLSRAAALNSAFRARRTHLPPVSSDGTPDGPAAGSTLIWRHLSLLALQGISNLPKSGNPEITAQGFFFGGLQLQTLLGLIGGAPGPSIHPAATAIPASLSFGATLNRQPVSYAVSPYAGLQFDPPPSAAGVAETLLVAELLTLDASPAPQLISPANQQWLPGTLVASTLANDQAVRQWATDTAGRVAADSPLALVRIRSVIRPDPAKTDLVTGFRFLLIDVAAPPNLAPPTQPLRAPLDRLRFQEGQYGGHWMPDSLLDFEAAPPQVSGVQPLWFLTGKSEEPGQTSRPLRLSALRLSVNHYTGAGPGDRGVVGPATGEAGNVKEFRLWWSATAQHVTFALPDQQRLLPPFFRASSIDSLLPAPGSLPLPSWNELEVGSADPAESSGLDRFKFWQPMLEDGFRLLLVGGRAGAPFAFRQHLITQFASGSGTSIASGSVQVQHRFPRPLPLPENAEPDLTLSTAQQPWPAVFRAHELPVAALPVMDNATFDSVLDAEASAVQITLVEPAGSLVVFGSPGTLKFHFDYFARQGETWSPLAAGNPPPGYTIQVDLLDRTRRLPFLPPAAGVIPTPAGSLVWPLDPVPETAATALRGFLSSLPHGAPLALELRVGPPPKVPADTNLTGYVQTLRFPLRLARPGARLLPLLPAVMQFEDPEYDRRLASTPAQQTGLLVDGTTSRTALLAADRREYNPTTPLFAAFLVKGAPTAVSRTLRLQRIEKAGGNPITLKDFSVKSSQLQTIQLSEFVTLVPGDSLEICIFEKIDPITQKPILELTLRVDIVAEPVIPAPEAGYALLRREDDKNDERIHAARFAWSPMPDRIDLLDPKDLTGKIVRRRAVFQWTDCIRLARDTTHATHRIQKINFNGSTHFPTWIE